MCDYSLHAHPNRLAAEGETLISTRFPGGSMGFTTPSETPCTVSADRHHDAKTLVAVCIPPGAQLVLENIPARLQQELSVSDTEFVTFTQLGLEAYTHRDAVRFENGREILLQRLNENQRARVLSLADAAPRELEEPLSVRGSSNHRAAPVASAFSARSFFRRAWEALVGSPAAAASAETPAPTHETSTSRQPRQVVSQS
jgi:hypothetical protein